MKHLLLFIALVALFLARPFSAYSSTRIQPAATSGLAMPRQPVKSSDIASIGYDESTSTLEVEFVRGSVYQYYGVPKSVYEGLMTAKSHGGYLAHYVKDAGYRYKEVN